MLTEDALAGLRQVGESMMTATAVQTRADAEGYQEIATLNAQLVPPGYKFGADRSGLPSYLRSVPVGTFKVSVEADVQAKDRLTVEDRLFEVIAPVAPKTLEVRRKFLVREINQPERELWLALKPDGYDGASTAEPLPDLVRVLPVPFIEDKPIETIEEREGGGQVAAKLRQLEVSEIARVFLTADQLEKLLYCLVVMSDVTPTAEGARNRQFPRYRFNGSPEYCNENWSTFFPWKLSLVQEA